MQKRFWTCGHMVLVRYLSTNGSWQPLFMVSQRLPQQHKITVSSCPKCGAPLNIHDLR
jgi:hypothetical protein